ncbi:MAG TPA: DUF2249 domain-containing protein [Clostridia bacterium]|nr:DUF2249 domain-containing protein [Clostridia bacterium]
MSKKVVTLDVREDLRQGREPFSKIMQTVAGLSPGQDLLLIAPFKPAPLFAVLEQQGFSHQVKATPTGDFEVLFSRSGGAGESTEGVTAMDDTPRKADSKSCAGNPVVEVDCRGLEPPQPLVKILEALTTLPSGARLRARTDRRPMHLYAQLEERGFTGESQEQPDGSFVTHVQRI